jgi:regulator of RNase E activity RraA
VTDWQVPIYVRGATSPWVAVRRGDSILADEDGAVVVPEELVEDVLAKSEVMTETEVAVRKLCEKSCPRTSTRPVRPRLRSVASTWKWADTHRP